MQNIQKRTLLILLAYGLFGASDTKQKTPFKFNQFNNYWIGNDILTSNEMTRNEAIKLIDGLLDVNIDILDEIIGPSNENNKNNKILIQNIRKQKNEKNPHQYGWFSKKLRIIDNLNKLSDDLDNIYEQLTNKDENQRLQKLMQVILKIKTIMKSRITGDIREERNRVYPLCCGLVILRNDHDISQNNKEFMIHSEKAIFAMGHYIELHENVDDEYYQKFKDSYKQYFGELIL